MSESLYEWAMVQFTANNLLREGKITESEHYWYTNGWIPATAANGGG